VETVPAVSQGAHSIPTEYSFIYQVWSQLANHPVIVNNARLKSEADAKLEDLFRKLESREMSEKEGERLMALTQAFHNGDYQAALSIQMELVKTAWEANKTWLPVVKNLIKAKQQSVGR
jgi:hypothetical protein